MAVLAKKDRRIAFLEKQQKARKKEKNQLQQQLKETIGKLESERKAGREKVELNQWIMNELEVAREKFEEFCAENPGGETEELVRELKMLENGR